MPQTNKITFNNHNKTNITSSTSAAWTLHATGYPASKMISGHEYFCLAWYNCFSPGTNEGATKLAFITGAGGDLVGSVHQRHNTNDSGQYVGHLGQFTAPDPAAPIGIYRKRMAGGGTERTEYGQFFTIDLSGTGMVESGNWASYTNIATRTVSSGDNLTSHTLGIDSGTCLIAATCRVYDATSSNSLVGLYVDDVLRVSGSRYTQDTSDVQQVLLAGSFNVGSGTTLKLKNIDREGDSITTSYSYVFALNMEAAGGSKTGRFTNWTDNTTSGQWGASTILGKGPSFVFSRGRQIQTGAESGRPASISVKNITQNEWMVLPNRPSGDFSPLYFPNTNYGLNTGQLETSLVVGTGNVQPGDSIGIFTI